MRKSITYWILGALMLMMIIPSTVFAAQTRYVTMTSSTTITVNYGDIIKISASNAQSFSSDKKSVATVDSKGVVTTIKEGTAKIKVSLPNKKAMYLTVKAVDPLKATNVTLKYNNVDAGTTITMIPGQTITLTATMAPTTATSKLTFSSSASKYATVEQTASSKCTVKALKKGTTTITVKTSTGKTDKVKIQVVANKMDDIRPKPTTEYIKSFKGTAWLQYNDYWLELKSIEIVSATEVKCQYYLINGSANKSIDVEYGRLAVALDGKVVADDSFNIYKRVKISPYSCKVVEFTFSYDAVINTNYDLTKRKGITFYQGAGQAIGIGVRRFAANGSSTVYSEDDADRDWYDPCN